MAVDFLESGSSATFDLSFYVLTTGTVASTSAVANGQVRSVQCTSSADGNTAAWVQKSSILGDAGRRISIAMRFSPLPTARRLIIGALSSTNVSLWGVSLNSNGTLVLIGSSGGVLATGTTVLSADTFYLLGFSYKVTSASVNDFRVYINGVLEITFTNASLLTLNAVNLRTGHVSIATGNSSVTYVSDVYVDDTSDLSSPGLVHVTPKLPNSNNVNNFNTAIGANPANRWTNVNERPLSETNGWEDAAASDRENYGIQSASSGDVDISSATIVARGAWTWAKATTGNTGTPSLTDNGVDNAVVLATTSKLFTVFTATSVYPSNAATIGMVGAGATDNVFFYECGQLIAYTPGPPTGSYSLVVARSRMREW